MQGSFYDDLNLSNLQYPRKPFNVRNFSKNKMNEMTHIDQKKIPANSKVKGQTKSKRFFKPTFPPKNEQTNSILLL